MKASLSSSSLHLFIVALLSNVIYGFSSPSLLLRDGVTTTSLSRSMFPPTSLPLSSRSGGTPSVRPWTVRGGGGRDTKQQQKAHHMSNTSNTNTSNKTVPVSIGKCPATGAATIAASLWGTFGVVYILVKAIRRVLPIALEPFQPGSVALSQFELGAYGITCLWFAYVEGYKGFQQKFSPLVVKRSFTLIPGKNGTHWFHFLVAPFYSMGLVHATRKRAIVSWSVTLGVALIVAAVKRLPYPYRNIIDAGVVAGLSWGSISIALLYLQSWLRGTPPAGDAALPDAVTATAN